MSRTRPLALIVAAVLGALLGFVVDQMLTSSGRATFTPNAMLAVLLALLAAAIVLLALPVQRAVQGRPGARVDPFRALRIAVLAKAAAILGAAMAGVGVGLAAFVFSRPVGPPVGSTVSIASTVVAGAVLVAAALIAERMCTIRKDDDDDASPQPGAGAH